MAYIVKREKTATGKNITINDVIGYKDLKLYGDTYQKTYSGKNLFKPFSYTGTSATMVFTYALDGSINCNGTTNATARSMVSSQASSYLQTITSGTYTISGSTDNNIRVEVCNSSGTVLGATYHSSIQPTFTISSDTQVFIRLTIPSGVTLTNVKVYPQLEKGSTATSYEKYVGGYQSPNPEYPQIVQTVTGKQEVEVVGENIFVPTLTADGTNISHPSNTPTLNADEYSLVASGNDMRIGEVANQGVVYSGSRGTLYEVADADTIYLYCTNSTFNKNFITFYDENKVSLGYNSINNSKTNGKKVVENAKYFTIRFGYGSAVSGTTYTTKVMVSRHKITDYVPYTINKYELNLGKNLFDKNNANILNNSTINSSTKLIETNNQYKMLYIPCLPNTTYTISKVQSGYLTAGYTDTTPALGVYVNGYVASSDTTKCTITTNSTANYIVLRYYRSNDTLTEQEIRDTVQIEKGSSVSPYSEYKTPIELCKIGDARDYIYKYGNDWYLHKEIGKVTLDGSETDWYVNGENTDYGQYMVTIQDKMYGTLNILSDRFVNKAGATGNYIYGRTNSSKVSVTIAKSIVSYNLSSFKTWLSTHNTDIYYQLATPTVEEITDEELINQLNAIELFDGINNISTISADINGELEINYYEYTNYYEVIYSGDAKHKVKIKFNGTELQDADRYCEKITRTSRVLSQDGSKRFTLDNFMSQEITLILHDIDTSIIQNQVEISIGTWLNGNGYVYVPLGVFNIQDTPTTDKNKTTIKLRDNRVKFDAPYNAKPLIDSLGGSATKKQILNDICTKSGVTNDVTTFLGEDDLIGTYDSTVNGNIYVIDIAEQAGLVPIITREGHLDFVNLQNSTIHKIPLSILEKYELGNSFEVKRIVFEDGIRKYQTSSDETLDTLYLNSANPYISSQEQINSIFSALENYKIDSVKTGKIMGDPAIDPWDLIQVYGYYTDLPNGNKQFVADENTIVFETLANQTMTYTGKIISTYDTQIGIEERKENVTIKNEGTYKKIVKAEIDQLNGSLTLLAQDLEENYSTTTEMNSAIQLSAQGIEQTVSQTYETKSDATSKLGEAKTYADDVGTSAVSTANNYTDGQLVNYSTTTEMNSAITQKANEITSTVAETYSTKVETTTAKDEAIASANSTTDDKLSSYSTTSEMNTEIQQTASAINTRINKISTNINEETGEVEKVTTSTGYTFDENGLSIEKDGSSFTSLLDNTGTYYKDNGSVVSQTTKDGTITKDMVLYGRYYYGVDNDLDVEHFTKDDAMFIAEMYEDGNGEVGFGHFLNNLGGN